MIARGIYRHSFMDFTEFNSKYFNEVLENIFKE